jgi:hypothetical protein
MKSLCLALVSVLMFGCESIKASNYPSTLNDTLIGAWEGGHLQKGGTNKRLCHN